MTSNQFLGFALIINGIALAVLCAIVIQNITFGGYVWMLGIALGGSCAPVGAMFAMHRP